MDPDSRLTLILAGAALSVTSGAWALARWQRRRRKSPDEIERLRRLEVNRRGRITAGQIVGVLEPENGDGTSKSEGRPTRLLVYRYEVAGFTYEAAQDVSALSEAVFDAPRLGGLAASVKYDPKHPTNSIIACEEWCGVKNHGRSED